MAGRDLPDGKRNICNNAVDNDSDYDGESNSQNIIVRTLPHKAMAYWLRCWVPNPGIPYSKPLGDSKVDSAFHPSQVDQMSIKNFWELSGEK